MPKSTTDRRKKYNYAVAQVNAMRPRIRNMMEVMQRMNGRRFPQMR